MWQSLYAVLNDAIHSKRVWAAVVAVLGLIGNEFFPQRIEMVLGVVGIVMALIFGDSIRPIAKTPVVAFLLCSSVCSAQQIDYWGEGIEPITNYANGLNIAKAEKRPLMLFMSQKNCPPCKMAWRIFDDMRQDKELGNCVLAEVDATTTEGKALLVGKKLTPQLMILDMRKVEPNGAVDKHATEKVDKPEIQKLLSKLRPTR
jgi:hypothetical protein